MAAEQASPPASRVHHRTCHLCEAMCGIEIRLRGAEILSIRGDDADPFSRGHICPKAVALKDVHEDPDRLRRPVRRVGDRWEEVSWATAFDAIGARLVELQSQHGRDSVALYFGNPMAHSYSAFLGAAGFMRALGTRNRYSATSVDQLPHHLAAWAMYGHQLALPIPDLDRTDFLLVLGANPVTSNGSLMTAPDVTARLKAIRQRGGRIVVIDPRRTETARLADEHQFIRPGTDALLLAALAREIIATGLAKPGRLAALSTGYEALPRLLEAFTPEAVAGATGIGPADIRRLAHAFASARTAACYGRMGVSTQAFGSLCQWLVQVLNVITGNLDRAGGTLFTRPAFDIVAMTARLGQRGHFARRRTRVRQLPEFNGEFPVAALAGEIAAPGPGQVRALITAAGNPVLSTPNGTALERVLPDLDLLVAIDFYINETTRHAHYILPPTFALERDHYDLFFHALAIRNTAKFSQPLFERAADQRHDWEIFAALQRQLEAREPRRRQGGAAGIIARWLTPRRLLAWSLRFGPYGAGLNPLSGGLTLGRLAARPHGVDLGPLAPALPGRLYTPDRRIQLTPAVITADLPRLAALLEQEPQRDGKVLLIGRRDARTCNSWMHNSRRLVKGPRRCTAQLHPETAALAGIAAGQTMRVSSRAGSIELPAEITTDLAPGVVSIPHGWGHDRPGVRLPVASAHAGVSANDLTDELLLDVLSGNAALNGVPVQIAAVPPADTRRMPAEASA